MLDFISPILLLICGLALFYGVLLGLKKTDIQYQELQQDLNLH
ncbi:hypothetical protein TPENAI_60645 [Tenacibaculum litopenaei]